MRRRSIAVPPGPSLPPLLLRVIYAAKHVADEPVNRAGEAAALEALAEWALITVPARGVLAPTDPDAYARIQTVAQDRLGYKNASRAFRAALARVEDASTCDAIETAENRLRSIGDTAYYYAGLACGLTLAHLASGVSHE